MSRIAQINDTIKLLVRQGNRINQCITELEKHRNSIINDAVDDGQEMESDLKKVKAKISRIDNDLVKIRDVFFA